jgi:hypothetical protein
MENVKLKITTPTMLSPNEIYDSIMAAYLNVYTPSELS